MQTIPYRSEQEYGELMLKKAQEEGHAPRLPLSENPSHVGTAQHTWRAKVMEYFETNPDPIYRVDLSAILGIEADTLRRVCRSLVVAGFLKSRRTQTGVVYRSPETEH